MLESTMANKTPISIRLDNGLLELLTQLSRERESFYFDRDRTWLIEYAIRKTYGKYAPEQTTEANGNSPPS
jgi:predicted transcriptional regulator